MNYLSYADGIIIFSSSKYGGINLIMNIFEEYETTSGQKVYKEKSLFYMHNNVVHLITDFQRQSFPFTYLGCTIFYSRRQNDFYGHHFHGA